MVTQSEHLVPTQKIHVHDHRRWLVVLLGLLTASLIGLVLFGNSSEKKLGAGLYDGIIGNDAGVSSDAGANMDVGQSASGNGQKEMTEAITKLDTTLNGMSDKIADSISAKLDTSNRVVVEKLNQLLAQRGEPPPLEDVVPDEEIVLDENGNPCPPEKVVTLKSLDERVAELENWRPGVDETLSRHARKIRQITKRLKDIPAVNTADVPGYTAPNPEHSTIVHLKYH
jgi:hypothetical protein